MPDVATLSRLRMARLRTGMSLRELAREVGISDSYLSLIETGHRPLTPHVRARLVDVLGDVDLPPPEDRLQQAEADRLRWEGLYHETRAVLGELVEAVRVAATHRPCCSAHGVDMSCDQYRRSHFVEVRPCCCSVDAAVLKATGQADG